MSKSRYKSVGIIDFFYEYPYKQNIPHSGNTIPTPYIKKEDVSLHEFACDYHLFKKVVEGYLDYCVENLIEGNPWRLDFGLGEIRIKKFKIKFIKDKTVLNYVSLINQEFPADTAGVAHYPVSENNDIDFIVKLDNPAYGVEKVVLESVSFLNTIDGVVGPATLPLQSSEYT